ncbi:MAG: hypothetical protein WEB00_05745 [Dehalococcoidia bacterium]
MDAERVAYKGWPSCWRLSDGRLEVIVTTDIGPRVMFFGFAGGANEFGEIEATLGHTGGDEWKPYGGHRLWHGPEAMPRSYQPDNEPLEAQVSGGVATLTQRTEAATCIQKEIEISFAAGGVVVRHRLHNRNLWPVELAAWGVTIMTAGGQAIIPLGRWGAHGENLAARSTVSLWAYTDMTDPRWSLGRDFLRLRQDSGNGEPQKAGAYVDEGWAAYERGRPPVREALRCREWRPLPGPRLLCGGLHER